MRSLLLLLFLPLAAHASTADDVAATFVEILVHDELVVTAGRVISNEEKPELLFDLRDLMNRLDCFSVTRYATAVTSETADAVTVVVDLQATATLKGKGRRVIPLNTRWHLEAKREGERWKLVRAQPEERRIAGLMFAAPSPEAATAILDAATGIDRANAIELYSDQLRIANRRDRIEHALALALPVGDRILELFVRRAKMVVAPAEQKRAALVIFEDIARDEHPDIRLNAWFTAGLTYVQLGEVESALTAYAAATSLVEETEDPVRALKAQQMQVWLLTSTGELTRSLRNQERLLELSRQYRWEEGELNALIDLGNVHDELHNYAYARDVQLRAARLARERGQRRHEVFALLNAARAEMQLGNYDAVSALTARVDHDVDPHYIPFVYGLAAGAAMQRGRFEEADALLLKGEAVMKARENVGSEIGAIRVQRSELHLRAGRTKEALHSALLALEDVKNWRTSGELALERVDVLVTLARALRALERNEEAVERLREAIALVDDAGSRILAGHAVAQIGMINSVRDAYELLVEMLVEDGQTEAGLGVAEQMRARGLRELIGRGHIDLSASMSAEERAREGALDRRLTELNRTLAENLAAGKPVDGVRAEIALARRELDAFEAEMRLSHPAVARRRVTRDASIELPDSWTDIAVVEYVVTDRQTIAFIVTRDHGVRAVRLPVPRETLERESRRFAREVSSASLTYRTSARRLHQLLLEPLQTHLGDKVLCIIPDGSLWSVPFHALIDQRGTYVVDRRAVFYAHSLSLARDADAFSPGRRTLLAMGNPTMHATTQKSVASTFRDVTLGSLADAEEEVRSLAHLYSDERNRVYYREAAREAIFKREAPGSRVIHVAAHAIVDDGAPLYSAIVLAAGRDELSEDGLLEAREVVDLPLAADLAVLSACETARGDIGAGEGVVGLAWAFFAAGCSTTVVSQWKAESRATSKLMVEFHRRLLAGDSPAAALRAAQIALRRNPKYRHPFFWAPFVAIGAADRPALP